MTLYVGAPGGPFIVAAAPVAGVAQVETATIVGTITLGGNATITVTAAGMTGSPKAISVAVLLNDTASVVAGKARTVLAADVDVTALFAVSGAGADIILTALQPLANDATLNIASANGTCTGLTAAPTSANTTAGVFPDFRGIETGAFVIDTTGKKIYKNTGTPALPVWTLL